MERIKRSKMWFALLMLAIIIGASCKDEKEIDDPYTEESEQVDIPENTIVVSGVSYAYNSGTYYCGLYPYVGLECTNFYIECSSGAGLTIELDEHLVGETVSIEEGNTFWSLAIGNGQSVNHVFVLLQNDDEYAIVTGDPVDRYSGWFRLERDLKTDGCSLLFVIHKNETEGWAKGNIKNTFSKLSAL